MPNDDEALLIAINELYKNIFGNFSLMQSERPINIERKHVYITNVVNYRPPNNRKPEPVEITKYSNFLRNHISIIDPKILILMGSTAMESLFGSNIKITKERGSWKDIIVNNKTYLCMITFHPAYLLRQPENKKYSWIDLKELRICKMVAKKI